MQHSTDTTEVTISDVATTRDFYMMMSERANLSRKLFKLLHRSQCLPDGLIPISDYGITNSSQVNIDVLLH